MDTIFKFIKSPLFHNEIIHISIFRLIIIGGILVATPFLLKLLIKGVLRIKRVKRMDHRISNSIVLSIKYFVWIIAIGFCIQTLGVNLNYPIITTKNSTITPYHINLIIFVLLVSGFIIKIIGIIFSRMVEEKKIDQGSSTSIYQILKYCLWILVIGFILQTLGIKITLLIASSAALLVGLGLGIQQIFHDVASGIILLFERNLMVNDIIEVEDQVVGKVKEIGLRTSKILTRDNIVMIIPNSKLISNNVINWSHHETLTRFHVNVGVAYGSNIKTVEKVLIECASNHPHINTKHTPFVQFKNFGDSSLEFSLFFWTRNTFQVEFIKSDLRFAINSAFTQNHIQIPFPQRDVHIINPKE